MFIVFGRCYPPVTFTFLAAELRFSILQHRFSARLIFTNAPCLEQHSVLVWPSNPLAVSPLTDRFPTGLNATPPHKHKMPFYAVLTLIYHHCYTELLKPSVIRQAYYKIRCQELRTANLKRLGFYWPWHRGFLLATAEPLIGRPLGVTHQQYPV